ncbi:hypothetical protein [Marinoscillum sp.]|uniref:hypothetical protein n=1 Tax=Marinoscillum sp. TaxID=2024838 RepID=UPI003BAB1AA1
MAITHYQYATAANVRQVLAEGHLRAPVKADQPVDLTQPLLMQDSLVQPLYQSAITGPLPNGSGGYRRTDHSWLVYNASVASLYNRAFHRPEYPVGAYRVLEMSDSLKALVEGPSAELTGEYSRDRALYDWAGARHILLQPRLSRRQPGAAPSVSGANAAGPQPLLWLTVGDLRPAGGAGGHRAGARCPGRFAQLPNPRWKGAGGCGGGPLHTGKQIPRPADRQPRVPPPPVGHARDQCHGISGARRPAPHLWPAGH